MARAVAAPPLFDFTAPDGIGHTIWRADDADRHALVAAFARIPLLYIADGHHRAASAMRARQVLAGATSGANSSPAGLRPGRGRLRSWPSPSRTTRCRSLPYHRVVKDLAGRTPASFLEALGARIRVAPERRPRPRRARSPCTWTVAGTPCTSRPPRPTRRSGSAGRLPPPRPGARAAARHRGPADGQADRLRRRHPRPASSRPARGWRRGRRRLRDAPGRRRGPHGDRRRRRDHAAQVHLVRAEAPGRTPEPPHLASNRPARRHRSDARRSRTGATAHEGPRRRSVREVRPRGPCGRRLRRRLRPLPQGRRARRRPPREPGRGADRAVHEGDARR